MEIPDYNLWKISALWGAVMAEPDIHWDSGSELERISKIFLGEVVSLEHMGD